MSKSDEKELVEALTDLNDTIKKNEEPAIKMVHGLVGGIAYGLGFVIAMALLLPVIIFFLKQFDWIPVFGDFFAEVAAHIESVRSGR